MNKAANQPTRRAATPRATPQAIVRRNWTVLLPAATALIIGVAVLASIFLKNNVNLLAAPGQGHIHAAFLSPDGASIWVGAHDGLYVRSSKLAEAGWQRSSALPNTDLMAFVYLANAPARTFAAGHSIGVIGSSDSGANWQNLLPGAGAENGNDAHALTADPNSGDLYVWVQKKGLLRSRDGGATWPPTGSDAGGQVTALLGLTSNAQLTLYAASTNGIRRSADNGATWQLLANSPPNGVYSLAGDARFIYAGTPGGLYQSIDSGQTWQAIPGLPAEAVVGVAINPTDGQRVVVFNDARVYLNSGGTGAWQQAANKQ